MQSRLVLIDGHVTEEQKKKKEKMTVEVKVGKKKLRFNVWKDMNLDQHLSARAVQLKDSVATYMDIIHDSLNPYVENSEFPTFIEDTFSELRLGGVMVPPSLGGLGFDYLEHFSLVYELARKDASVATFFGVHNSLGVACIDKLGDEKQRAYFLPKAANLETIFSFGLTEPNFGSDATSLQTTARKVKGGWVLNGTKRWIGNAPIGTYTIIWARNMDDTQPNKRIQAFVVKRGQPGLNIQKMEGKLSLKMVQNADITLEDVFVPDFYKLTKAESFEKSTNQILMTSRLGVAWMIAGAATGAYETCLRYCLGREQFGKPIAQFPLVQERLSRMLGNCEFMLMLCMHHTRQALQGRLTNGQVSRAKAACSRMGRETVSLARESMGGNGILLQNHVMKVFTDMEALYTYEGTYDVNHLVSGRELTGGLNAIKK